MPPAQTPSPFPAPPALVYLGRQHAFAGLAPGFTQPALATEIDTADLADLDPGELPARLAALDAIVQAHGDATSAEAGGLHLPMHPGLTAHPVLGRLARLALAVLAQAGMPVMDAARLQARQVAGRRRHDLFLPSLPDAHSATAHALRAAAAVLNLPAGRLDAQACLPYLQAASRQIQAFAPVGINTLRLLRGAHRTGVPWLRIARNVYQFGWGANARWLDSTFTDATSVIGAALARDKAATIEALRVAGLPVTEHRRVTDEQGALDAAATLGYPVVVKAGNLDGGQGVHVGLGTPEAVAKAFARVRQLTRHVLVERLVEGNDYRLQVFHGEVFWLTHRRPAAVTGDGTRTVEMLIREVNIQRRQTRQQQQTLLKPIEVDDEALDWLASQQLTLQDVPAAGRMVRLRGAANISSGGTLEPVLDRAHPDNLALAIRAARVLRLDLAGVDLLIPDIGRSWLETGAAICEVNAQPQVSPHLPAYLLSRLVRGQGRIPVVAIIGDPRGTAWFRSWRQSHAENRLGLGVVLPDETSLDAAQAMVSGPGPGALRAPRQATVMARTRALLSDPAVQRVLIVVDDPSMLHTGLPVDALDGLVLAAPLARTGRTPPPQANAAMARRLAIASRQILWSPAMRGIAQDAGWPGAHPHAGESDEAGLMAALDRWLQLDAAPALTARARTADAGPAAP